MTQQTKEFIYHTIFNDIVWYSHKPERAQAKAVEYGVNLEEFKKEHSEQIVFALLQKEC